jgi:hypothetical protein
MMVSRRLVALTLALGLGAAVGLSCAAPAPNTGAVEAVQAGPGAAASAASVASASPSSPSSSAVAAASGSVLQPRSVNAASLYLTASYDVDVTLHYDDRLIAVDSLMTIRNDSGGPIDRLELNTIAARLGGGLRVTSASVDGRPVSVTIDDQTLVMPLGGILLDGGTIQVRIGYRAHLRSDLAGSNWMFTRTNGIIDAYRWLPWVSRRVPFNRPNHGDPFITPVSPSVRVRITTDRPMVIAATGERVAVSGLTQTFSASDVRDFTITASPSYRTTSAVVGGATIRVYYRAGGPATAMLSAGKNAIAKMSALVGAYPYSTFKVVQSAGGYGMESPALIWVPTGVALANLRYLVHHETAHQWFYGIVGSNQPWEPYTDEAAADFLARYVLSMRRASQCSTARLDLSIYRYSSTCYYEVIYIQGGNFLDDLRRRMGSTAFWRGMRTYLAQNRFKIALTRTLLDTLDEATTLDLVPSYRPRFPRLY